MDIPSITTVLLFHQLLPYLMDKLNSGAGCCFQVISVVSSIQWGYQGNKVNSIYFAQGRNIVQTRENEIVTFDL